MRDKKYQENGSSIKRVVEKEFPWGTAWDQIFTLDFPNPETRCSNRETAKSKE